MSNIDHVDTIHDPHSNDEIERELIAGMDYPPKAEDTCWCCEKVYQNFSDRGCEFCDMRGTTQK